MKAGEITDKASQLLHTGDFSFGFINFANPDMVGHTGDLKAATQAVEVVDCCLGKLMGTIEALNGVMLITADHGNVDEMKINIWPKDISFFPKTKK